MPSYKLTYFDARGRAELTRILFALAGQEFEDVRLSRDAWKDLKSKTPLGQLPVLEVDGKSLPQSMAIAGYVAREFGLYGSTNWEAAQIDAVLGIIDEFTAAMVVIFVNNPDQEKRAAAFENYNTEEAPKKLKGVNDLFTAYENGYFVGNKISLADAAFYALAELLKKEELAKFPKLSGLFDKIASHEKLVPYLKSRPATAH